MAITQRMGRPVPPALLMSFLAVGLLIVVAVVGLTVMPKSAPTVGYSQFLADVEGGRVISVVQTGTVLEVTAQHGAYQVTVPSVLTDVFGDVHATATEAAVATPEFVAQPQPDTSWIGLVLSALLPFAVVLVVFVLVLLLVVRPARREASRSLTE